MKQLTLFEPSVKLPPRIFFLYEYKGFNIYRSDFSQSFYAGFFDNVGAFKSSILLRVVFKGKIKFYAQGFESELALKTFIDNPISNSRLVFR